jgi:hypothetical protein
MQRAESIKDELFNDIYLNSDAMFIIFFSEY